MASNQKIGFSVAVGGRVDCCHNKTERIQPKFVAVKIPKSFLPLIKISRLLNITPFSCQFHWKVRKLLRK